MREITIQQVQNYLDKKDAADTRSIKQYPWPDTIEDFLRFGESRSTKILVEALTSEVSDVDWTEIYRATPDVNGNSATYYIYDHCTPGVKASGFKLFVSDQGIQLEKISRTIEVEQMNDVYSYSDTPRFWGIEGL